MKVRNLCPLLQRQFLKDLLYSLLFKSPLLRMLFGQVSPRRFPRRAQGRANAIFPPSGSGMKSFKLLSNLQSFQSLESGQKHFLLPISVCGHLSTRPCCCLSPYYFSFFPFKQLSKLLSRLSSCATMRLLNCNLRSADLRKTLAGERNSILHLWSSFQSYQMKKKLRHSLPPTEGLVFTGGGLSPSWHS